MPWVNLSFLRIKHLVFAAFFAITIWVPKGAYADKGMPYGAALQKAIRYTRARNYKQSLKYFKLAVKADPSSLDPYFNVGSLAEHFKNCRDQLLYFRGFLYLAGSDGATASFLKTAKSALRRCKKDPKTGYLTVITDPPKLEVMINGALVGKTPLRKLALKAGTYTCSISNPLFNPFSAQVEIQAKKTAEMHPQPVKKIFYGWLGVKTVPKKGVEVFFGDRNMGKTPLKKVHLKTGKYLVRLKVKGYDLWQRYVEVDKDMTTTVDAQMQKIVKPEKFNMDRWKKFK